MVKESLKWQLLLIFLLTAVAGYFAYPSENKPFFRPGEIFYHCKIKAGLDIQGGSELILGFKSELSPSAAKEGVERAINVIQRRINALGLKEPIVRPYGADRLQVQLPGIDPAEVARVKNILMTSGKLEFKLEANKDLVKAYEPRKPLAPQGYRWYIKPASREEPAEEILVEDRPILDGSHIADAGYGPEIGKGIIVHLKLTQIGATIFADVTGKHHERSGDPRRIAIILDDNLISAPGIIDKITGGEAIITRGQYGFPLQEAEDLAMVLKSGNLPAPLEIISENTVGPTLGKDAINRAVLAFILAIVVIALAMVLYYHLAGLIGVIALLINAILILGTMALFGATLTLPGMAGIILTMGMAIDSNVLFYERIREEKEKGSQEKWAFETGFARALITVFDANFTTLIAGLILLWFGTGAIKGFAITLSIGILTTLFTAYFATQAMMRFALESGILKRITMFRLLSRPRINFMKRAVTIMKISLVVVLVSFIISVLWGEKTLGIEFGQGTILNLRFKEPVHISQVREAVRQITITEKGVERPKYPDVEIQTVLPAITKTALVKLSDFFGKAGVFSNEFQIRTRFVQTEEQLKEFKNELRSIFKEQLIKEPIKEINALDPPRAEYRMKISLELLEAWKRNVLQQKLTEAAKKAGLEEPWVLAVMPDRDPPEVEEDALTTNFAIYVKEDISFDIKWLGLLKSELALPEGPFPQSATIGSMVSQTLQRNAVISILLSWIAMIIYLAIRFELKFGLAAVVALIHDVIISLGVTIIFNLLVPDTWGINVEITFASVAAFMTIIGYSVNDTIVTFDRIRENLRLMKKEPLDTIINTSINQTLSRTIITNLFVLLTVVILFGITARSGGGIASFAFPMIIGAIVGTYSTIFIASPFVKIWGGTTEPRRF